MPRRRWKALTDRSVVEERGKCRGSQMTAETTKRPKRGHGEGSYRELAPGKWRGRVMIDGRAFDRYATTRKEAAQKIRDAIKEHDEGLKVGSGRQTVENFLNLWLEDHVRPHLAPKTILRYEIAANK